MQHQDTWHSGKFYLHIGLKWQKRGRHSVVQSVSSAKPVSDNVAQVMENSEYQALGDNIEGYVLFPVLTNI